MRIYNNKSLEQKAKDAVEKLGIYRFWELRVDDKTTMVVYYTQMNSWTSLKLYEDKTIDIEL